MLAHSRLKHLSSAFIMGKGVESRSVSELTPPRVFVVSGASSTGLDSNQWMALLPETHPWINRTPASDRVHWSNHCREEANKTYGVSEPQSRLPTLG